MKLSYRGHSYHAHENTVPATEVPVDGKYRGKDVTYHNKQTRVKHDKQLIYRGVRHTGG